MIGAKAQLFIFEEIAVNMACNVGLARKCSCSMEANLSHAKLRLKVLSVRYMRAVI